MLIRLLLMSVRTLSAWLTAYDTKSDVYGVVYYIYVFLIPAASDSSSHIFFLNVFAPSPYINLYACRELFSRFLHKNDRHVRH
jgi:hypothetical protein